MDPSSYLDLAKDLVARAKRSDCLPGTAGQAECRSAISRSYYAAYNVSQAFLDMIGIAVTKTGKCHVSIQFGLNNSGDADLIAAAAQLGTLYSERRNADYEMSNRKPESIPQAENMTAVSDRIIALIRQCKSACQADPSKKAAVAQTILDWAILAGYQGSLWKK